MSKTTQEDKLEKVDFKWGVKRGRGGAKKDVQFYESFTYDGMEYFLYDSVYLFKDNEPEPYVGKLIKIWEHSNKAKRVKILWFFRPSEILDYLQNEKVLDNELFLATGDGVGLANINPLEAIAGKCNIVCIAKDDRNQRPSMEELEMADHVFYRTFDVHKRTISDKLGEKIAAVEVKLLLNKTPSILPKSNSNVEGDSGNMVSNMEKVAVQSVTSPRDGEPVKAVGNLDSSVVKEGVTVTESVKIRLKSPDSETYKHDRSSDPSDGQFKSSFGKLRADSASSAAAVNEKTKLDLAKDFHQRVEAAQKVKSVNDGGAGEERPYKKLKCEGLGKQSSDNFKNDVDNLLADSHSSEDKFSPRLARNASENKVESFGIDKSSSMKLKSNEVKTKIPNEMLGKSSLKKIKDVPIEAYGQVVEVTRRPNAMASETRKRSREDAEVDYIIPRSCWRFLQVNQMGISTKAVAEIREILKDDEAKLALFSKYNVGHLLELLESNVSFWHSMIHAVLLHQVDNPNPEELSFLFGGKVVRFGLREFCIITGLKYSGLHNVSGGSNRLIAKYGIKGRMSRQQLLDACSTCPIMEDQVKLAVAYLVEGLLFAKHKRTVVDTNTLAMVDNVDAFNRVAWGSLSWKFLVRKLKDFITKMQHALEKTYSVHGFYDVVSIFAIETIPELARIGVARTSNRPLGRILNWNMGKKGSYTALFSTVFDQQLNAEPIKLTIAEASQPNLQCIPDDEDGEVGDETHDVAMPVDPHMEPEPLAIEQPALHTSHDGPSTRTSDLTSQSVIERLEAMEKGMETMRQINMQFESRLEAQQLQLQTYGKRFDAQEAKIKELSDLLPHAMTPHHDPSPSAPLSLVETSQQAIIIATPHTGPGTRKMSSSNRCQHIRMTMKT